MTQSYNRLRQLLAELFQFDREDLDFGIYRIMNHKRDEILGFLDRDLLPQVEQAFAEFRSGEEGELYERKAALEAEISTIAEQAAVYGGSPEKNPRYGEALGELAQVDARLESDKISSRLEDEVYSDLYTFFRRYYKNGDFLSLRRYKPGVYAVPYEGEEVKLHWANADQYYVKTAENFRNYRFELEGVGHVNFELVAAATEQDNNKPASGKERRFVLREEDPIAEADGELHVYFEYWPHPDKQEDLRDQARDAIFDSVSGRWKIGLAEPRPTQSNKKRTLLEKHLAEYTARNTFDYFIHKDFGGFLGRELDFFLKSEVLHIDDLDTDDERRVEQYLSKLKVLKRIGHKIIAFLAQIEDFQNKLFLKKKFVVSSGYCVTLDNVPEKLYEKIVENDVQYAEWERLFAISEIEDSLENTGDPRSVEWLKANPYLVLDTKHFSENFKDRLLASIENLDEKAEGLLIESENFQALNLLQARYRERVKCIYIDPPYNTGNDEFLYKDNYQHSSWLSMMNDRLRLGRKMLSKSGANFISIDDREILNLGMLTEKIFGAENFLATFVKRRRMATGMRGEPVSPDHEYVVAHAKSGEDVQLFGNQREETDYPYEDSKGKYRSTDLTVGMTKDMRPNQFYAIHNPRTKKEYWPPENRVWRFQPSTMQHLLETEIIWPDDHPDKQLTRPRFKTRFNTEGDGAKTIPVSTWMNTSREEASEEATEDLDVLVAGMNQEATKELKDLFGYQAMDYPKPVSLAYALAKLATSSEDLAIDYFAGSGTTGHAVIKLNREDGGRRKYVLVEMGEYFDSVLKPRIQKVIYSKDWKDGRPVSREGTSHIFKYMTLESYEDTLNNLFLRRTGVQEDLIESNPALREEYMLSYMLDFETKNSPSLLNLDAFEDPFSYKLNITSDDETRPANVDLVETFNYLLGLTVSRMYSSDGFRVVEGTNPAGERALVIWRNTREKSNDGLGVFFEEQGYAGAGDPFDRVYANGDNALALKAGDAKVHLIEEEFRRLMFETEGL